ncbi:hypothetical protein EDB19DRAFT_1908684 [Suillus lakei]|nr:hypothetical protein EDB19DRAFT_1908684 [Suillus lakei]
MSIMPLYNLATSVFVKLDVRRNVNPIKAKSVGLFKHFPTITREEHLKTAWVPFSWELEAHERDAHRSHCAQEKAKQAMVVHTVNDALHDLNVPVITKTDIAKASRPYREIQRDARTHQPAVQVGRKHKHNDTLASHVNWQHPLMWTTIVSATHVGISMSPSDIVREVQQMDLLQFHTLTPQVVGTGIDCSGDKPVWTAATLARAQRRSLPMYQNTRKSILSPYPDIIKTIMNDFQSLQQVGVALDTLHCHGIILAHLQHLIPEIFEAVVKDGSCFHCSETWVKEFLNEHLNWTFRRATRAAQKLPPNVDQVLLDQFLRLALTIHDCAIFNSVFLVNIDQTNIVYQPSNTSTFKVNGLKQVAVIGQEEKLCLHGHQWDFHQRSCPPLASDL